MKTRVYAKDPIVRILHWTIFFCVLILIFTGLDISHPFLVANTASKEAFITGNVRVIHFWTAMIFDVALFTRIAWMFLGPPQARWNQFIPTTPERWRSVVDGIRSYLFIGPDRASTIPHDGFDGLIFAVRFLIDLVMVLTGFALYSTITSHGSPMAWFHFLVPVFGGEQSARWIHHIFMWVLIVFVVHHIITVIMHSVVRRDGTVDSIFSGYKVG